MLSPKHFRLILALLLISGISRAQEKISVKVFPEINRQQIQSVGGNYCQTRYTTSAWDAIGEQTLKEFKPGFVRVAIPLQIRKVPYTDYKGSKFTDQPLVITLLETLKRMKVEFGVKKIILSSWDVPDELVADPSKRNQRVIKPESYDEVLDMLVVFMLKAKNDYGVEIDYFSFNESDGGWQVIFTPAETIAFIKKAKVRFDAVGLTTKFLLADVAQTKGTVEFASMIYADSSIWDCLGPLSFHCWWSENIPDSEFERVAAYAKALNKPVWCTELGFDAEAHKIKGMFQSWDYALRLARIAHRMFKYAEVEASMYWTWQNDYPIMSTDLQTMYPSYFMTRHMTDYLKPETQIIHSISSDPDILALSGIHADGTNVLQLINMKKKPVSVDIEGYNCQTIDMVSTTELKLWDEQKIVAKSKNAHTIIQLLPESVNTLVIK
jgi:hypothetical protein